MISVGQQSSEDLSFSPLGCNLDPKMDVNGVYGQLGIRGRQTRQRVGAWKVLIGKQQQPTDTNLILILRCCFGDYDDDDDHDPEDNDGDGGGS